MRYRKTAALTAMAASLLSLTLFRADIALSDSSPRIVDPAAAALSEAQGIPLSEAAIRIDRQAAQSAFVDTLARHYPSSFAGGWVDQGQAGTLVVRFRATPPGFSSLVSQAGLTGNVTVGQPAKISMTSLTHMQSALDHALAGSRYTSAVDPRLNQLVLRGAAGGLSAAAQATIARISNGAPGALKLTLNDPSVQPSVLTSACAEDSIGQPGCTQPLRGGQRIVIPGNGSCTLGFSTASNVDNKPYSITAGHCLSGRTVGDVIQAQNSVGQVNPYATYWSHSFVNGSSHDWGIVALNSGIQQEGDVYVQETNDGVRATTRNENYAINGVSGTVVGGFYCKTGASGGTACGQVTQTGVTTTGPGGLANLAEVEQRGAGRYTCAGDSGGPVYAGNRGVGLVQGGNIGSYIGTAPNTAPCYYRWYYVSLASALNDMHVHLVAP
jgi:streptogrisin C